MPITREKLIETKPAIIDLKVIKSSEDKKENVVNFNSKISVIENYLISKYEFRYNTIKGIPEWRIVNSNDEFQGLDDYKLNSIYRECELNGIPGSVDKLYKILNSDFIPRVNPIHNYFKELNLSSINETENLDELISSVITTSPLLFPHYFKKWIIACVANSMIEIGCQNHTCLVLTGSQGKFKTTWLDNLCPPKLRRDYLFTGKINVENKDSMSLLAECFLLNIDDQLRNLNKQDENSLKTLITLTSVKIRKPYARMITEQPRLASFMGSVNGNDFLTDPTGSRRFLPFEVVEIDINKAKNIDMNKVWAEAYKLFLSDFKYWFSEEDMEALNKNNEAFQVESTEYQLLNEYFIPCKDKELGSEYLQPAVLQAELEEKTKYRLSQKKIGEALNRGGFEKCQKTSNKIKAWVWIVKRKTYEEITLEHSNPDLSIREEDLPF
jgi:predicted P-loop ATPase